MSQETILGIARQLLTGLPFIGRKTGREAVADFHPRPPQPDRTRQV